MNSSQCIILVPIGGVIDPKCEQALHALERAAATPSAASRAFPPLITAAAFSPAKPSPRVSRK